jgi:hypothetical protein
MIKQLSSWLSVLLAVDSLSCAAGSRTEPPAVAAREPAPGARFAIHPSRRYFQDASGNPVFLLGYYMWAAIDPTKRIDLDTHYHAMMNEGAAYKLNYIRLSLSLGRIGTNTSPFVWAGGKADLDQVDESFWAGLRQQLDLAAQRGFFAHVALFDGVNLRNTFPYAWPSSFWNPANQVRPFYPDVDRDCDARIDEPGEFYRPADFTNATGIGTYQRRIADRAALELEAYPNAFIELGNELFGSTAEWNQAAYEAVKTRTTRVVTQNGGGVYGGIDGNATHHSGTSLALKAHLPSIVGKGHPAWDDPDGPDLKLAGKADENRRAAWYSLAGGAAGWGGFTVSVIDGWDTTQTAYYRTLMRFLEDSRLPFWEMTPQHDLVSNGTTTNSVLAKPDAHYLVYVREDSTVTLDLSGLTRPATGRTFDPKSGAWGSRERVTGGASRTFGKPAGADDWVILITVQTT